MSAAAGTIRQMFIYIGLVAFGSFLGSRRAIRKHPFPWLVMLQTVAMLSLITALGIKLGADDQVISSLGRIGLSASAIALSSMAGSLGIVTLLRRFILKLDRFGCAGGMAVQTGNSAETGKADHTMTLFIVAAVLIGMAAGHFLMRNIADWCGTVIDFGLYLILFLVGLDMGQQGEALGEIRSAGIRALLIPFGTAFGSLLAAALISLSLSCNAKEAMAVSAGFGWYSLAPSLLASYSSTLSATAFLSNVIRELVAILVIPAVAKHVGYLECASLPGAAAMDTVLPVVVEATHRRIAIYSFTSGVVLSLLVPILVPLFVSLPC